MLSEGHVAFKYIFLPETKYVVSPVASILLKRKKNSILNCCPSKFIKLSEKKFYGFSNIISIRAIF